MKSTTWHKIILLFCILVLAVLFYKKYAPGAFAATSEGFSQKEKFVLMKDADIYDEFYADIYDYLHWPTYRVKGEISDILANTQADPENSDFLDVGSGTGAVVNELRGRGYRVIGIDKSKAMVTYAQSAYPDATFLKDDVENPMAFEPNTFSHILCLYHTIYHFSDKKQFFRHCHRWLKPGGALVIHLVDRDQFDVQLATGRRRQQFWASLWPSSSFAASSSSPARATENTIRFSDFEYKVSYDFASTATDTAATPVTETFTDAVTSNIRQNEYTLYIESLPAIVALAQWCGFAPHGVTKLKNNEFMYYFVRI